MHLPIVMSTFLILILLLQFNYTLSKCCWWYTAEEPCNVLLSNVRVHLEGNNASGLCSYKTCRESGNINGYYFNRSLPLNWSKTKNKYIKGNKFCGVGKCNMFGCDCERGCKEDLK